MGIRQTVGIAVLLLAGTPGSAEEPPAEYARVEVRAKLYYSEGTLEKPKDRGYTVGVARPKEVGVSSFRLEFTTKELEDLAKDLRGTLVVVAGDLTIETTGGGLYSSFLERQGVGVIRVTSLRRAAPAKK
jgi:hypothetical protein